MSLPVLQLYHNKSYPAISPGRPELSQAGKSVVIAGGSSGIGYAIARAFGQAGSQRVIILGRRQAAITSAAAMINGELGKPVTEGRVVDIAKIQDIDKFWAGLQSENIHVDVLIVNAAAFGNSLPILENGFKNTWNDFETNVRGPLHMTELFYKQKPQAGSSTKYLVNVSSIAAYMWSTMGPERPSYGLTKNAGTALMQQIAKDTRPEDMQMVSFHPGAVLTDSARANGFNEDMGISFDNENLPGDFAVWAASSQARFLHGRFVLANWDVEELKNGVAGKQIEYDEHFLKVGIEGLLEKTGGIRL